ncbi:hypothetical protein [Phaeobacter sp. 22II1-1F12B]|uniref:hypothetical protein n=1 Tax=Phaeobacter sp. 22II1-1F12B TaxID=1317111 RepID=UPI000B522426|nr:hypothetical protein [Phaeobacter sp. 22II1-1F12B]OWU67824.1 hypothetical protein ATO1_25595 [Phaeobacter sp. 22II1-1F12B]|tara:strand:+ start:752 stop:1558 length:807 start_codon:yes stop_codon:yes gene_type:complete
MCIEPLRKRTVSGKLYTRRDEISAFIRLSLDWPFDELLDKAAMRDRRHADYVPSEVLLYHLRQTKTDNADGRFVALYNILLDRIEAACPRPNSRRGDKDVEDFRVAEIRDKTIERVTELMFEDRRGYVEQLDAYEVFFDRAVRSVRIDKFRQVSGRENATESVVHHDGSEDIREEVEEALERYKKSGLTKEEDFDYRFRIRRAIDALPEEERKVIDLMLAEIPIETNKDGEPSMTQLLGCVEKTVRNRRDRAFEKIRRALKLEDNDDQ